MKESEITQLFFDELEALREAAGITDKSLAQRSGVHYTCWLDYKNGRRPITLRKMSQICEAVGLVMYLTFHAK